MIKKVLIALVILALAGGTTAYYLYNKKVPGLEDTLADVTTTADILFDEYEADETTANEKYLNKVVEVTGIVMDIASDAESYSVVLDSENAMVGAVNCSFKEPQVGIKEGDKVTIKGQCQGYLLTVLLNNCVLAR